jgi:hypothetical protein
MRRPSHGKGVCSECKQPAEFSLEDFGIGAYEFWGARGTHHDWQWVSECCEASPDGEVEVPEPDYPDREGEY